MKEEAFSCIRKIEVLSFQEIEGIARSTEE